MTAQWILNEATGRLCLDGRPVRIEFLAAGPCPFRVLVYGHQPIACASLASAKRLGVDLAAELAEFGR